MTTMMLQLVEKLDLDGNIVGGVLEAACGHAHSLSSYDQSKVDLLVSSMLGLVEAVLGIPMLIVLVVPGGQELLERMNIPCPEKLQAPSVDSIRAALPYTLALYELALRELLAKCSDTNKGIQLQDMLPFYLERCDGLCSTLWGYKLTPMYDHLLQADPDATAICKQDIMDRFSGMHAHICQYLNLTVPMSC